MSALRSRGPIVIDTDVFSADLVPGSRLTERYASLITGRPAFISFQTAAELRYGGIRRGWGHARMLRLQTKLQRVEVVHSGPELVGLRTASRRLRGGRPRPGPEAHTADRRIAATAIRLAISLVSNDGIFRDAPGLQLETLPAG